MPSLERMKNKSFSTQKKKKHKETDKQSLSTTSVWKHCTRASHKTSLPNFTKHQKWYCVFWWNETFCSCTPTAFLATQCDCIYKEKHCIYTYQWCFVAVLWQLVQRLWMDGIHSYINFYVKYFVLYQMHPDWWQMFQMSVSESVSNHSIHETYIILVKITHSLYVFYLHINFGLPKSQPQFMAVHSGTRVQWVLLRWVRVEFRMFSPFPLGSLPPPKTCQ